MSDCTPDETDLLDCYAGLAEKFDGLSYDEGYEVAERTLADIKACAWAQGLAAAQYEHESDTIIPNGPNPYREQEPRP